VNKLIILRSKVIRIYIDLFFIDRKQNFDFVKRSSVVDVNNKKAMKPEWINLSEILKNKLNDITKLKYQVITDPDNIIGLRIGNMVLPLYHIKKIQRVHTVERIFEACTIPGIVDAVIGF
jgi:hypothetical protein